MPSDRKRYVDICSFDLIWTRILVAQILRLAVVISDILGNLSSMWYLRVPISLLLTPGISQILPFPPPLRFATPPFSDNTLVDAEAHVSVGGGGDLYMPCCITIDLLDHSHEISRLF